MPYGITQCYLPPGKGDIPAFTPAEVGVVEVGGTGARVGWLGVVTGISSASTGGFLVLVMATRRE